MIIVSFIMALDGLTNWNMAFIFILLLLLFFFFFFVGDGGGWVGNEVSYLCFYSKD